MQLEANLVYIVEIFNKILCEAKEAAIGQVELGKLTLPQFRYLEAIHRLGNPTFTELKDYLNVTKASVTSIIDRLIKTGYVIKIRSAEDSRSYHLHLTAKAQRLMTAEHEALTKLVAEIKKHVNEDETEQLNRIFAKLVNGMGNP